MNKKQKTLNAFVAASLGVMIAVGGVSSVSADSSVLSTNVDGVLDASTNANGSAQAGPGSASAGVNVNANTNANASTNGSMNSGAGSNSSSNPNSAYDSSSYSSSSVNGNMSADANANASMTVESAMAGIQDRGFIRKFFFGPDYARLDYLKAEASSTDDAETRSEINAFVEAHDHSFSLFGWLVRLFR